MQNDYKNMRDFRLLVIVALPEEEREIRTRLFEMGARGAMLSNANGSASPGIMSMLGFDSDEKTLLMALAPQDKSTQILQAIGTEFFAEIGRGMGFSLDIQAFAGLRVLFCQTSSPQD